MAQGTRATAEQRFWLKVNKAGPSPEARLDLGRCWQWTAHVLGNGYGQFNPGRKLALAHRYAYELLVGPIPAGLTIDHLCRNRACVRPTHLEPVTQAENVRRSVPLRTAQRTHCPQGHPYAGANLSIARDGSRQCRTCRNANCRASKERTRRR